ncbi:uncharacterized protein LOC124723088 [Schistocerca piceifrons]|uniref:uncharacterized protein LOC124723088 n=1 Tax=Schistocerca piceifrons TaxID=274613 RepID=UPI001F5F9658|nr:uncharacterized protein LOC124723088 [Schistocerca piceifrons]
MYAMALFVTAWGVFFSCRRFKIILQYFLGQPRDQKPQEDTHPNEEKKGNEFFFYYYAMQVSNIVGHSLKHYRCHTVSSITLRKLATNTGHCKIAEIQGYHRNPQMTWVAASKYKYTGMYLLTDGLVRSISSMAKRFPLMSILCNVC